MVSVSIAQAERVHLIAHRAVLAARGVDDWWDSPLETALAAVDLARHAHAYSSDTERAFDGILRWWKEGSPRRTSGDVAALALLARASVELQRQESGLLSAAIEAITDLASRSATVSPMLHLTMCAWALDPLVPDRAAAPWPALRARFGSAVEIGVNIPLKQYAHAISQLSFNPSLLVQDLVSQIGAAAGPSDSCILIWLTTIACEKVSAHMTKEDSGLQVLFRRRSELSERLAGEIDDRTFREPDPSEFDPDQAEIGQPEQVYLSTFEAVLLDCGLASREPIEPWLTYEEADRLFGDQATQARSERDSVQRRLSHTLAAVMGLFALMSAVAFWLVLSRFHVNNPVAIPAAVALASTLSMPAVRFATISRTNDLLESLGVFLASLAILMTVVAINGTRHKPFISDVNGLIYGTLIAVAAAVIWAFFRRSHKSLHARQSPVSDPRLTQRRKRRGTHRR